MYGLHSRLSEIMLCIILYNAQDKLYLECLLEDIKLYLLIQVDTI